MTWVLPRKRTFAFFFWPHRGGIGWWGWTWDWGKPSLDPPSHMSMLTVLVSVLLWHFVLALCQRSFWIPLYFVLPLPIILRWQVFVSTRFQNGSPQCLYFRNHGWLYHGDVWYYSSILNKEWYELVKPSKPMISWTCHKSVWKMATSLLEVRGHTSVGFFIIKLNLFSFMVPRASLKFTVMTCYPPNER